MKTIKINEEQLREKIEEVIREAAGFQRHGGEVQLYGRIEDGEVTEFWTETFAGHSSWVEGDNIIGLYAEAWFDPMEHENYDDWFKHEDESQDSESWEDFSEENPDRWEELLNEWRELWLEHNVDEMVRESVRRLEDDEEIELV